MSSARYFTIELVQQHLSTDELEAYNASRRMLMSSSAGARMHLEDVRAPTCPLCHGSVRVSDWGRYVYYRRPGVRAPPITRFVHEGCVRKLWFARPRQDEGMGAAWIPHGGELGSVF